MPVNLSARIVELKIGGVDYTKQLVSFSISPNLLGTQRAGGFIPYEGQIVLMAGAQPIDEHTNFGLFGDKPLVEWKIQRQNGTVSPGPVVLYVISPNYDEETALQTIAVGDLIKIKSDGGGSTDSTDIGIGIGFPSASATDVITRLLNTLWITNIVFQSGRAITFHYPRNFGNPYAGADQLLESMGSIAYSNSTGAVIIKQRATNNPAIFSISYSQVENHRWQPLSQNLADIYEVTGSYYAYSQKANPNTVTDPDGTRRVESYSYDGTPTKTLVTTIKALGSDIYAGLTGLPTGSLTSETHTQRWQWANTVPGELNYDETESELRLAIAAQAIKGWLVQAKEKSTEGNGSDPRFTAAKVNSLLGQFSWSSNVLARRIRKDITYDDKFQVTRIVTKEYTLLCEALEGLGGVIEWDYAIENTPLSLTQLIQTKETTENWVRNGAEWGYTIREKVRAALNPKHQAELAPQFTLANQGDEALGIDPNPGRYDYLISQAIRWTTLATPTGRGTGNFDAQPPSMDPPPSRYGAIQEQAKTTVGFVTNNPVALRRAETISCPYVTDVSANAINYDVFVAQPFLQVYGYLVGEMIRAHDQICQLTLPLYDVILDNWSPWLVFDYTHRDGIVWRLAMAPSLVANSTELIVSATCPTLGKVVNGNLYKNYQTN